MPHRLNINESFICRIWEGGEDYYENLKTTCGKQIEIITIGKRNYAGGPDYLEAVIKIGGIKYKGDIEVHRDFKGWSEHLHKGNRKYNSVILQVVLWNDGNGKLPHVIKGRKIFTTVLSKFLKRSINSIWQEIITNPSQSFRLSCYELNSNIDLDSKKLWIEKLARSRLKLRTERFKNRLKEIIKESELREACKQDFCKKIYWDQLLMEFIFEALGYTLNKDSMLKLSRIIPIKELKKLLENNTQSSIMYLQSVYFGLSGLLYNLKYQDEYIIEVKQNWKEFSHRFNYQQLDSAEWQFFRLRPPNFPTVRIAYGTHLILKIIKENLFKNLVNLFKSGLNYDNIFKEISKLLLVDNDKYWSTHFSFGKTVKKLHALIGSERISDISVNVIVPILNLYSEIFKNEKIKSNVIHFYYSFRIRSKNSIVRMMRSQLHCSDKDLLNTSACEQGIIHLYNFYCIRERCSECDIGKMVFKQGGYVYKILYY